MTAGAPLWLVREHGAPVGLYAATTRSEAVKAAMASHTDLVLGDATAALIGAALPRWQPGQQVANLRAPESAAANLADGEHRPRGERQAGGPEAMQAVIDFAAATAGITREAVLHGQARLATAVRRTIWAVLRDRRWTLSRIGQITGHSAVAVRTKVLPGTCDDPAVAAILDAVARATNTAADSLESGGGGVDLSPC